WKAMAVGAISGAIGGAGGFAMQGLGTTFGTGLSSMSQTAIKVGADTAFGVVGSIAGDLAVGNPITWQSIAIGAGIGLAAAGVMHNLGNLGSIGKKIQGWQTSAMTRGMKVGFAGGAAARGAVGMSAPDNAVLGNMFKPA